MKYRVMVDDEDYDKLMQYNWSVLIDRDRMYAHCIINGKNMQMHRMIMNAPEDKEIDHIDMNGLNNQKYNLRIATKSQNCQNIKNRGRSKYYGVSFHNSHHVYKRIDGTLTMVQSKNKWMARINLGGGKRKSVGCFFTDIEAAVAYDKAVKLYNLEFCKLNFPDNI